jgi:hypothetical protein
LIIYVNSLENISKKWKRLTSRNKY